MGDLLEGIDARRYPVDDRSLRRICYITSEKKLTPTTIAEQKLDPMAHVSVGLLQGFTGESFTTVGFRKP